MTSNYVTITIAKFHTKKFKILQILQLAICQLICNMYDWKYFVILVPASYIIKINVSGVKFSNGDCYIIWCHTTLIAHFFCDTG
jgi:hypothetical protein